MLRTERIIMRPRIFTALTAALLTATGLAAGAAPAHAATAAWYTLRPGDETVNVLVPGTSQYQRLCTTRATSCPNPNLVRSSRASSIALYPSYGRVQRAMVRMRDHSNLITVPRGARGMRVTGAYPIKFSGAQCRKLIGVGATSLHIAATTMLLDSSNRILYAERTATPNLCGGVSAIDEATLNIEGGFNVKDGVYGKLSVAQVELLTKKSLSTTFNQPISLITDTSARVAPIKGLTSGSRVRLYTTALVYASAANGPSKVVVPVTVGHPAMKVAWTTTG